MAEAITRLAVLAELLNSIENLNFWKYTADFELLETNCGDMVLFQKLLQSNGYPERIRTHFEQNDQPIALSDSLGFVWLAVGEKLDGQLLRMYLLGPTFTAEFSERNLEFKIRDLDISFAHRLEVIGQLKSVPTIDYATFMRYGVMLNYCITGSVISRVDIALEKPMGIQSESVERWQNKAFHGTWNLEQTMVRLVEDGNLNYEKLLGAQEATGKIGLMCPDDPLRQAKDAIIGQVTLVSRAAIRGGVTPELSYSLSDYYIQMIEECKSESSVYSISREMVHDYVQRVHKIKSLPNCSTMTLACMDYVSMHISDKFSINDIAKHLGYADYYLTTRFKKETGENLRDYINRKKIEQAKLLLGSTDISIQDISERLHFANASYFSAVFRKYENMTPGEYRNNPNS